MLTPACVNASMVETLAAQRELLAKNIAAEEQRGGSERERLTALVRGLDTEIGQLHRLYAAVRLALYRVIWQRTEATIQAQAQENSTFIESVRAIQSVKLFNRETERESQWLNRYNDVVGANVRLGRAKIAFTTINDLVFGLENIIIVYLAA